MNFIILPSAIRIHCVYPKLQIAICDPPHDYKMSKAIYYIEVQRPGQAPSKFKFAIDTSKKVVKDVKQQIKNKLVQKKSIEDTHQIILRDSQLFELCSDDEIDDVVPETDKNIVVTVKGDNKPEPQLSSSASSISQSIPSLSSVPSSVPSVAIPVPPPVVAPAAIASKGVAPPSVSVAPSIAKSLADCHLKPTNKVLPFQDEKHDLDHIQLRFTCPQLDEPATLYGLVTAKKQSFYELSCKLCQLFNFKDQPNLKAVLYHFTGQPMIWAMDYMSLMLPEIDEREIFTVVFTNTTTTSEIPVKPLGVFEQKQLIFVKAKEPMGFKVDLQTTTVGDLQVLIYQNMRIHPENQLIRFGVKTLIEVTQPLHVYDIKENSMIELSFKVRHRICSLTFPDNFYSQQIDTVFPQTVPAKRTFRANLLIFCHKLPAKLKIKMLAMLRQITHNNAMVCTLATLFASAFVTETQKIALEQGFFNIFRDFLEKSKDLPADFNTNEVFKYTRQCLGYYLDRASKLKDMDEYDQRESFLPFSQTCESTLAVITDPVYIKLDNNTKTVSNRDTVLNMIKNKTAFKGVSNLNEGSVMEDKNLKEVYSIFARNNKLNEVKEVEIRHWLPKIAEIDYLKQQVDGFKVDCKYNDFANTMTQTNAELKIFNPLELKTKVDYIYLLKDKNNEEKIYVGKHKDIHSPHLVYDVISGSEVAINFDIVAGAAGSESVQKVVGANDIKAVITRDPAEAIVVLLDISGSMGGKFFNEPDLKRIGAVKSFFEALAYRTMAYNFEHVISLILFDDKIDMKVDFTESFHDFNLLVANAHPRGSTLLYDAIVVATQNLLRLKKKYPNTILRILALTDGEDTGSKASTVDTTRLLRDSNILIDSFVVGSNCEGLKSITFAAGGKCYLTRNIQESLKLFEQETVLSSRARKVEEHVKCESVEELVEKMKLKPFDMPNNVHEFKLPEISKPAIDSKQLAEELSKDPNKLNSIAPTGHLKRIVKELTNYQANPHPFVAVFPCQDMTLWKILMMGPHKTPYEGGLFQLYAKFPAEYPFKAPEVRFVTPIYHCNMNSQGRICHSVFDRNYSPAITFKTIVDSVYGLILTPEPEDPLDNVIATYFLSNYQQYYENAVKATKANASKTVEEIVESLFGKITDDNERQKKIHEIKEWIQKAEASN